MHTPLLNILLFSLSLILFSACQPQHEDHLTSIKPKATIEPVSKKVTKDSIILPQLTKFTCEKGGFSIGMPCAEPLEQRKKSNVEFGEINMKLYICERDNQIAHLISYTDYPRALINRGSSKKILKGNLKSTLMQFDAKIVEQENVELEERYKGLRFQAQSEHYDIFYEFYLVDQRLYQIGLIGAKNPVNGQSLLPLKSIPQYFSSFVLIEEELNS